MGSVFSYTCFHLFPWKAQALVARTVRCCLLEVPKAAVLGVVACGGKGPEAIQPHRKSSFSGLLDQGASGLEIPYIPAEAQPQKTKNLFLLLVGWLQTSNYALWKAAACCQPRPRTCAPRLKETKRHNSRKHSNCHLKTRVPGIIASSVPKTTT